MGRKPNVFRPASELIEFGMCPFRDERFEIPVKEPCPVCGMLGDDAEGEKCVGYGRRSPNSQYGNDR